MAINKFGMGMFDQLLSIATRKGGVYDGDLIGKNVRDTLVELGLVERTKYGYNILTAKAQGVIDMYIRIGRIVQIDA